MNLGYRLRDASDSYTILLSFDERQDVQAGRALTGPTAGYSKYITFAAVPPGANGPGEAGRQGGQYGLPVRPADRLDYKEPAGGFRPVKITYNWEENGQAKSDVHVATQPRETTRSRAAPRRWSRVSPWNWRSRGSEQCCDAARESQRQPLRTTTRREPFGG